MHTPPAPKLSLQDRRSMRDRWDPKRPEFEKKLTDVLGVDWKCEFDPLSIAPHAGKYVGFIGEIVARYYECAISRIEEFIKDNGDTGKEELNTIASAHTLGFEFDPDGMYDCCGPIVKDGALVMVFSEGKMGADLATALRPAKLISALSAVPRTDNTLPTSATLSIATSYDPKIDEVRSKIASHVGNWAIKVNPNWMQVFGALKAAEDRGTALRDNWTAGLGSSTLRYFEGAADRLESRDFPKDEMLREAFNEAVDTNEITLRIVDKLEYGDRFCCECKFEEGVLYIQTTPKDWAMNVDEVDEALGKIIDRLDEGV